MKRSLCFLAAFFIALTARAAGKFPSPGRAVEKYQKAAEKDPFNPRPQYNLGRALYEQGDFQPAQEAFDRAAGGFSDRLRRSQAFYNAGNALFRQGKFSEAVEKYKQALRMNPADLDAKHNLEFAQKIQEAGAGRKDDPSKSQKDKKSSEKNKSPGEPSPDKNKKEEAPAGAPEKKGEMSREDAERLLQALDQQEKDARKKAKAPPSKSVTVEEDW